MSDKSLRLPLLCSWLFCMLLLLSACNSFTTLNGTTDITHSPTIPIHTSTSCPAPGSGRVAQLPPLTTRRQNQTVVYLSQHNANKAIYKYDTRTGKTTDIFTISDANDNVQLASVSPNGQWITLTLLQADGVYKIQLVRIDGAYAQTLYCSLGTDFLQGVLLSPDLRHLAFNEKNHEATTDTLNVLDTTTGKIQIELSAQQPGYPTTLAQQGSANQTVAQVSDLSSQTQMLNYSNKLLPQPSIHSYTYVPIRWASNSSLYLFANLSSPSSGPQPNEIYQLRDIHKQVDQQSSNLKSITAPLKQNGCLSYAITSDTKQLICSTGPTTPIDTTVPGISIEPITGGPLQAIYQAPVNSSVSAQAAQGKTLLFDVMDAAGGSQLYRIQTNGTGIKLLASTKLANNTYLTWRLVRFLPWRNASFDGQTYALESVDTDGLSSLIIGSMNGGKNTTIATHISTLIGWATA